MHPGMSSESHPDGGQQSLHHRRALHLLRPLHASVPDRSEKNPRRADKSQDDAGAEQESVPVAGPVVRERVRRHSVGNAGGRHQTPGIHGSVGNSPGGGNRLGQDGKIPRPSGKQHIHFIGLPGGGGIHPEILAGTRPQHHSGGVAHAGARKNHQATVRRGHQNRVRRPVHLQKAGGGHVQGPCGGGHHIQGLEELVRTSRNRLVRFGAKGRKREIRALPLGTGLPLPH